MKRLLNIPVEIAQSLKRIAAALESKFVFLNWRITVCCPKCGEDKKQPYTWRHVNDQGQCVICGTYIITREGNA